MYLNKMHLISSLQINSNLKNIKNNIYTFNECNLDKLSFGHEFTNKKQFFVNSWLLSSQQEITESFKFA